MYVNATNSQYSVISFFQTMDGSQAMGFSDSADDYHSFVHVGIMVLSTRTV
jgi:hypothetical protein